MIPETCLLCGSAQSDIVFDYDEPDVYERAVAIQESGYRRAWVRCRSCGFHYSRFSRDPDALDRIYDRDYRSTGRGFRTEEARAVFERVIALPFKDSESLQRIASIRQTVSRLQAESVIPAWEDHPRRLLDVGGASGVFAYLFRDKDWATEIVDPGIQGSFVERHGVAYHPCRFDDGFAGGPYHLVSMNYFLEHVKDPCAVLGAARKTLHEHGLLYVEVPDEVAFLLKPKDDDIFNSCHLWMFGPVSLQTLLVRSGFDPLSMTRGRSPRGHFYTAFLARVR